MKVGAGEKVVMPMCRQRFLFSSEMEGLEKSLF